MKNSSFVSAKSTLSGLRIAFRSVFGVMLICLGHAAAQGAENPAAKVQLPPTELAKVIDANIAAKCKEFEVDISGRCTDAEFIRRAHLDILGVIPTAEKVAQFLDSKDSNKRAKLIDELLEDPRYGKHFGEIWTNAMLPKLSNNRRLQDEPMKKYMAQKLNNNTPWDKVVHEIVTASGPINKNTAITFFVANPTPDKMIDKVSQLFMGVQLQCAQCHDHPFTDTKQDDYWAMAAFFMKVNVNGNPNQAAKKGKVLTVSERVTSRRRRKLPVSAKTVPAQFLAGTKANLKNKKAYRPVLADWITSKNNPYFARAISNKLWYHFIGRGIVNPVDDMHADNPASHPKLLNALAEQAKANDFDLKYMIRAICLSETYQRSSRPTGNNAKENDLFCRSLVRQLTPEQLYDSLEQVIVTDDRKNARKKALQRQRKNKNYRRGNVLRDRFVAFFQSDSGFDPTKYQAGIPQVLSLMNARQFNPMYTAMKAMKAADTPEGVVEHLFLSTLSRRPTEAEKTRMTQFLNKHGSNAQALRTAYTDIAWALIQSSEFATNH
ncbi:MAG: DUF1549 and DUF1553 domain-containing protein [Gemmataceae bacterium]